MPAPAPQSAHAGCGPSIGRGCCSGKYRSDARSKKKRALTQHSRHWSADSRLEVNSTFARTRDYGCLCCVCSPVVHECTSVCPSALDRTFFLFPLPGEFAAASTRASADYPLLECGLVILLPAGRGKQIAQNERDQGLHINRPRLNLWNPGRKRPVDQSLSHTRDFYS